MGHLVPADAANTAVVSCLRLCRQVVTAECVLFVCNMATECVLLCSFVPPPVQGCKGHGRTHHCRMCSLPMQYGYRTCSLPMQSHCRMCSLPMQYGYRMCSLVWLQNVFSCLRGAVEGRLQNAGGNKDPIDLARIVRVDVYARKKRKKEKEKSFKKKKQIIQEKERTSLRLLPLKWRLRKKKRKKKEKIIQEKDTNHSRKRKNITKAPSSQISCLLVFLFRCSILFLGVQLFF